MQLAHPRVRRLAQRLKSLDLAVCRLLTDPHHAVRSIRCRKILQQNPKSRYIGGRSGTYVQLACSFVPKRLFLEVSPSGTQTPKMTSGSGLVSWGRGEVPRLGTICPPECGYFKARNMSIRRQCTARQITTIVQIFQHVKVYWKILNMAKHLPPGPEFGHRQLSL